MTKKRRVRTLLLLSLGSTLGALLIAEVAVRIVGYDPLAGAFDGRDLAIRPSSNPARVYELTPGAECRLFGCDVSINSHGLRDREFPIEKTPGVTRILALGDSITFGNELRVEETWSKRLEAKLTERGVQAEILNLGVGGYDTAQEIAFLEETGLAFRPDYVVLAFCVNDVATVSVNFQAIVRSQRYSSGIYRWSRLAQWAGLRLERRTTGKELERERDRERLALVGEVPGEAPAIGELRAEVRRALDVLDKRGGGRPASIWHDEHQGWYCQPKRLDRMRHGFSRLAELAGRHGFEVIIFIVPFLDEGKAGDLASGWQAVYRTVSTEAEHAGFRFVDMYPTFAEHDLEGLRIDAKDMVHPNAQGHSLLADVLAQLDYGV